MTGRERQQQIEEALTPNERAIIASIIDHSDESETVKKWLRHVIRQHDALAARLSAAEAREQQLREALREIVVWDGEVAARHGNVGVREFAAAALTSEEAA